MRGVRITQFFVYAIIGPGMLMLIGQAAWILAR